MIKAVIFDIGDAMEPSTAQEIEILKKIKKRFSLPENFVKVYMKEDRYHELHMCHAYGEPKIMKRTLKKLKVKKDYNKLSKIMNELYWKEEMNFYKTKRGKDLIKTFKFLKKNKYKVGILSDNSNAAKKGYLEIYRKIDLPYDSFLSSEDIGAEKPNKKTFIASVKNLKVKPEEAVYVGNNLERDLAAKKYGLDFIWVYGYMDVKSNNYKGKKVRYISINSIKKWLK